MPSIALLAVLGCPTTEPVKEDRDGDGFAVRNDCNDEDASIYPGAEELPYDGLDQDCDGEDLVDVDGDGHNGAEVGGADCDDTDPELGAPAGEVPYNGIDDDCVDGDEVDVDNDGYVASHMGGDDCDDFRDDVHPGLLDDCYEGDEDCDGVENEDADQDGDGVSTCGGDCDDLNETIQPGAYDVAENGVDENCYGGDKGNCGDAIYEATHDLWVDAYGTDCFMIESFQSVGLDESWQLPEWATCIGTNASWEGTYGVDITGLEGVFTLELVSGCGSFSGEGSNGGLQCDEVTADIGFSQACIN